MKKTQWFATHILTAVLVTVLVFPCVHAHEENHNDHGHRIAYQNDYHHDHVTHNHDAHSNDQLHGHAHIRAGHIGHQHEAPAEAHSTTLPDPSHVHIPYHENPIADLLLSKLEQKVTGHAHHAAFHTHFFNWLLKDGPKPPSPASHTYLKTEKNQAASLQTHVPKLHHVEVEPVLTAISYVLLITNIPPPTLS